MSELAILGGAPVRTKPFPVWPQHDEREERVVNEVIRSGNWWRNAGHWVKEFEEVFANYHDAKYGLAVNSGTASLEISMYTLGIGPGDEVIIPAYTFVATATAVLSVGAIPVFADVDAETFNIDVRSAESLITDRTKAIAPVHFAGCPCQMDELLELAKRYNLKIIEDACHAHGGKWDGKGLGSFGDMAGFSFQASKNMTSGDGGIVLTNDEDLIAAAYSRHTYGQRPGYPWYSHHVMCANHRMTEMQAAILSIQLERLREHNLRRMDNAKVLDHGIAQLPGLVITGNDDPRAADRVYHLYMFRFTGNSTSLTRDRLVEALLAEGIPASIGYPVPLYKQPLFEEIRLPQGTEISYSNVDLPVVERLCQEAVWFPQNTLLGAQEDTQDILRALEKVLEHASELQ